MCSPQSFILHTLFLKKKKKCCENKVFEIYQFGKGYKAISKVLGLNWTTVWVITFKWRRFEVVVNTQKWPNLPKFLQVHRGNSSGKFQIIPEYIFKELQISLASAIRSVFTTYKENNKKSSKAINHCLPRGTSKLISRLNLDDLWMKSEKIFYG